MMIFLWLNVMKGIFIVKERLEIMGWVLVWFRGGENYFYRDSD